MNKNKIKKQILISKNGVQISWEGQDYEIITSKSNPTTDVILEMNF